MLASELESEVVALEIGGQFLFDMAEHRDFLGAIVNLGITRDGVSWVLCFFLSWASIVSRLQNFYFVVPAALSLITHHLKHCRCNAYLCCYLAPIPANKTF